MNFKNILLVSILAASIFFISYWAGRAHFVAFWVAYTVAFGAYFLLYRHIETAAEARLLVKIAWILRGGLIFSIPTLSDDIYRFIWDGRLLFVGENPFAMTPQMFFDMGKYQDTLTAELFNLLNSKNYYSVYPPICQAVFGIAVWLFPKNIYASMVVIKAFLWLFEGGTLWLMRNLSPKKWLLYALNPFIIIELCGNGHFEAAMIFFFILALTFLEKKETTIYSLAQSSTAWVFAVAAKLLPLMFLPILLRRLSGRSLYIFGLSFTFFMVVLFLPSASGFLNASKSIALYFNNFQFNASIFYFFNFFISQIAGYHAIHISSPILIVLCISSIFYIVFSQKSSYNSDIFNTCLFINILYLLFATTVHPWYIALPVALSVFTDWRFPLVWSFFIGLTYFGYIGQQHTENMVFLCLEYAAVIAFFMYEKRRLENSPPLSI